MEEQRIKELVQRMKQGEQAAYEEVYRETYRSVYFICLGFMKHEENAKDAMQDTYMTAFSKLEQLKEEEKFQAWLKQIAVNRCKRLLEHTSPELLETEDLENLKKEENENFLPEEYITNKAKRKIVMDIMRKKLSDIQYQTVILFYFNGLEIEEIADLMECPPGTVKSRLSVARNKIKEGVLEYEKESKDKLYSFVGIPFLTSLLAAEASGMEVPDIWGGLVISLEQIKKENIDLERKNSFDRKREESKIVDAKSDSAIQDSSKVKGDSKMSNKIKAGAGAVKSKIIIGAIAAVVLIGTGIGIAVGVSKGNESIETPDNGTVNVEDNQTDDTNGGSGENVQNENNGEELDVQEEMVLHQAFDEQIRWMTSHNFSSGQLENAPEGVVLFPNGEKPLTLPVSFDSFSIPAEKSGTILEPGKSMNVKVDEYEHFLLNVRNMSNAEMTVDECLANGWASITIDGYGHPSGDEYFAEMFGYSEELSDTNAYLDMMIETYGSPSYVDVFMTSASVSEGLDNAYENVVNGNTNIYIGADVAQYLESAAVYEPAKYEVLTLAWEFDEYVISLTIYDSSTKKDTGEIYPYINGATYHTYFTREGWDYVLAGDYTYGENVIDQIYPEGMVLPAK